MDTATYILASEAKLPTIRELKAECQSLLNEYFEDAGILIQPEFELEFTYQGELTEYPENEDFYWEYRNLIAANGSLKNDEGIFEVKIIDLTPSIKKSIAQLGQKVENIETSWCWEVSKVMLGNAFLEISRNIFSTALAKLTEGVIINSDGSQTAQHTFSSDEFMNVMKNSDVGAIAL